MNAKIESKRKSGGNFQFVSEHEFWVWIGIVIAAGGLSLPGDKLWKCKRNKYYIPAGYYTADVGFDAGKSMSNAIFSQLKPFLLLYFNRKNDASDWSEIRDAVEGYNKKRRIHVSAGSFKILDEIMCAWRPRQDKFGGLPHISFVARKPKPLGKSDVGHLYSSHIFSHIFIFCLFT